MHNMFKNRLSEISILVVEDDEELSQAFSYRLQSVGYSTVTASTVSEAIKKLSNQKFQLIIVDMILGRETGEKIINVIRKDLCGLNTKSPILVCSGQLKIDMFDEIQHFVDDVIVKPFELDVLVQKANYWTSQPSRKDNSKSRVISSSPKLLVVDDDKNLADNICGYLNRMRFQAVASYRISDAQAQLSKERFDFILMDRHVAHSESTDLIKNLVTDIASPNRTTPIVVMTGDLSEDFINLIRQNVDGFLRKPVPLMDLPKMIQSWLGQDE